MTRGQHEYFLSYYEGHYLIPQPPILWPGLLTGWVQWIFRRDPSFARTLRTEITPRWRRRTPHDLAIGYPIDVLTLGEEQFRSRLAKPFVLQTEAVGAKARGAMRLLQALNVGNWIGYAVVLLQGHYPIVLIACRSDTPGLGITRV